MSHHSLWRTRVKPGARLAAALIVLALSACNMPATPTAPLSPTPTEASQPASEPTASPVPPPTAASPIEVSPISTPSGATPVLTPPVSRPSATASYLITFNATWSEATHPIDFPANPHFSGLIGSSHRSDARLWSIEGPASPGIQNMAETGAKSPLDSEIEALIDSGSACATVSVGGIAPSPGQVTTTVSMTLDCSVVSLVSMIAPSPDWFVGVFALSLFEDGDWVEEKVVNLYPYDAGTDSGGSYASPDAPIANPRAIRRIREEPLLIDGEVPPLGTFTFSRIDE